MEDLKKLAKLYAVRVSVLLNPSLYRALILTFLIDIGSNVTNGQITTNIGIGSLGQSIGVLSPADFNPVCI